MSLPGPAAPLAAALLDANEELMDDTTDETTEDDCRPDHIEEDEGDEPTTWELEAISMLEPVAFEEAANRSEA